MKVDGNFDLGLQSIFQATVKPAVKEEKESITTRISNFVKAIFNSFIKLITCQFLRTKEVCDETKTKKPEMTAKEKKAEEAKQAAIKKADAARVAKEKKAAERQRKEAELADVAAKKKAYDESPEGIKAKEIADALHKEQIRLKKEEKIKSNNEKLEFFAKNTHLGNLEEYKGDVRVETLQELKESVDECIGNIRSFSEDTPEDEFWSETMTRLADKCRAVRDSDYQMNKRELLSTFVSNALVLLRSH